MGWQHAGKRFLHDLRYRPNHNRNNNLLLRFSSHFPAPFRCSPQSPPSTLTSPLPLLGTSSSSGNPSFTSRRTCSSLCCSFLLTGGSRNLNLLASLCSYYSCSRFLSTTSQTSSDTTVSREKVGPFDCGGVDDTVSSTGGPGPNARHVKRAHAPWLDRNGVVRIVRMIQRDGVDMERELNQLNLRFNRVLVNEIICVLNDHGAPSLRFFKWILSCHPEFSLDSGICNNVVDNLGHVKDYESMFWFLKELSRRGHCLTENAFNFLIGSSGDAKDSVRVVVEILNRVGGSCCGSGIHSLIRLLCSLNSYELSSFVIKETARKASYYNLLIAAKCRNGDFQGAADVLEEMRKLGCKPTTVSYNYLLGSLFKNGRFAEGCELLQVMEEVGYLPDPVIFEVVIFHACKVNRMDLATEFLDKMLLDGLRPRFTTHAAFIKSYFQSGRAEDAHKYVLDMSIRDSCSANMNYSLLASLFRVSRRVVEAGGILYEMMEKGLKPNFPVYIKVVKDLWKFGRSDLASDLSCKFSKFPSPTHAR